MMALLHVWQSIGIGAGLIFAALVIMQKAFDRCARPYDPTDRMDYRLHMDRDRTNPQPKDLTGHGYDKVAIETLRRVHDRRRKAVPDTGQRRRRTDRKV